MESETRTRNDIWSSEPRELGRTAIAIRIRTCGRLEVGCVFRVIEAVREFKKKFILTVLQENKGNQCRAARELAMHRNTLSRTISELKIDVRQLRDGIKRPPRSARPMTYERKAVR